MCLGKWKSGRCGRCGIGGGPHSTLATSNISDQYALLVVIVVTLTMCILISHT